VVKGVNFVRLRDAGDPVEQARVYEQKARTSWSFWTSPATHESRQTVVDLARRVADEVFIPFTIGGGIRTPDDARALIRAGADKISINSAGRSQADLISVTAAQLGSQAVVVAIDAQRVPAEPSRWEVYVNGGRVPTGLDAVEWAKQVAAGEVQARFCSPALMPMARRRGTTSS